MLTMADSTNAQALDTVPDVDAIAGYINGRWPTASQITRKDIPLVTISITAEAYADVYDVESGDLTPEDVPRALQTNPNGIIYCALYTWDSVKGVLSGIDGPRPSWWAAIPGYNALYPGSIATQYMQRNGCDISIVARPFWTPPQPSTRDEEIAMFILDTSNGKEYFRPTGGKSFVYVGLTADSQALTKAYGTPIPLSHDFVTGLLAV